MPSKLLPALLILASAMARAQSDSGASAVSERDFLGDVPVVLSVSRLAQPVDEAPGAVTVLDRQFIRNSGARDVVDLLRLVPGFQTTTSFETDAPLASYHGRSDDWANRIQVLVDGRSVYSGHLQGSAGLGLQTLALDDIARIEILRGSNSATYGARAFLGVINIISRDVRDVGSAASLTMGDNMVADAGASIGWGLPGATYRISVDSRGDDGLRAAYGRNRVSRVNAVASWDTGGGAELDMRAGGLGIDAGRGSADSPGNVQRMRFLGSQFVQMDWRKPLESDQDIQLSFSRTENTHRDTFRYQDDGTFGVLYDGIPIDFSAREVNDALSLQHTIVHTLSLRTVWGAELRREQVSSHSSFDTREQVVSNFSRLFGSAEWRLQPDWVLNAGAMAEQSDMGGGTFSPRLMVNWHALPGHTLRAGVSSAFRPPSAYEKYAAVRYYDINGNSPITTVLSSGSLLPEKIYTRELGYNYNLSKRGISGDVRFFDERITDGIERPSGVSPGDYRNIENFSITGVEHQIQWRPTTATQLFATQTWTQIAGAERFKTTHGAARYAASLMAVHTLSSGTTLSLMHQQSDDIGLMSGSDRLYSMGRTDIRVAQPLRFGKRKAELAFVVQNVDQPYRDGDRKFFFDRRAFVSLRVDH